MKKLLNEVLNFFFYSFFILLFFTSAQNIGFIINLKNIKYSIDMNPGLNFSHNVMIQICVLIYCH